jgi:hypothetical protein
VSTRTRVIWKIPRAAEVEKQIGISTPEQLSAVKSSMRALMRKLGTILRRNSAIYYAAYPKDRRPCDTCAFSRKTFRWRGFVATSHGLMRMIRDQKPFICHANQPGYKRNEIDAKRLMVCRGFGLIASEPEAREAAACASQEISENLSGVASDPASSR